MNRRTFLRRMLAGFVVAAAAAGGWWKFGGKRPEPDETASSLPGGGEDGQTPSKQPVVLGNKDDASGALLSFMILSDLHISGGVSYPSEHLRQAFDDMLAFESKIESIVITGDITEAATDSDYKEFRNVLKGYKLPPIYANMGNHDYYNIWISPDKGWSKETMPNSKTDAGSRETFMKQFNLEKPYSEATLNGYTVLLLSQEAYVQEKPEVGEGAWYSDEQLAWLKERLAARKDDKPVFVMIHQPLPPAGQNGGNHTLIRAKEFRSILKPHANVFVFSGHNHQDFQNGRAHYFKETFHWFHNSSVGRVLNTKYEHVRQDAAQGLYVQVFADKVELRGREFSNRTWIREANWTVPLQRKQTADSARS
ncbi:metallophosphoesterase family protein [Paenibacillus flagellatus]|uniref:Phosphohydrolase n=1 Tax=Paenibacillus flagellatus TaxID=2211139 RepID=A0A2V5K7N6_9BACL|nr:metallophosphoesterase [Paenibacillus flagellatus]PYI55465.1 phosphohydrolase [Paenibacillus flagellatus]